MKWVIFEGPDNIGKSTFINVDLAQYVHKKNFSHVEYAHFSGPQTKNPQTEMRNIAFDYITKIRNLSNDSLVINDRSIFGELVYSRYRNYVPNYIHNIVNIAKTSNIEVLFIVIYANKDTHIKFNIPRKDEKEIHEGHDKAEYISTSFIHEIHKLDFGKVVVINSNNYESLDQRNQYILKHVDAFLSNSKYQFLSNSKYRSNSKYQFQLYNLYNHIPFSNYDRFYDSLLGFSDNNQLMFDAKECDMYKDSDCELGLEHSKFSNYGLVQNKPTNGFGSVTNAKYIFVGETPEQKGCGTLGIPFYGDISGNLFMSALYENNISLFNCYITNVIKCCPNNNDLRPYFVKNTILEFECVKKLRYELLHIINTCELDTIYAVGDIAFYILTMLFDSTSNIKIKKIYHPTYYIRTGRSNKYREYLYNELKLGDR